ncbi:MAG: tetratricopeptide repeat protein [Candidatus Sericytochromatia bacterium]|nr:tetratricopeptide repeat protein [Candidatus Sericytochromatia bacterium]
MALSCTFRRLTGALLAVIVAGLAPGQAVAQPAGAAQVAADAESLLNLGRQEAGRGARDRALSLLQRSLALAPEQLGPLVDLGIALADLGAYDAAKTAFERALRVGPDDAAALNGLGYVLYRLERHPAAIVHYRRALDRKDDPQYHLNLGLAYLAQQRWGQAEDEFRVAARGPGAGYWAHNNLGYALQLQGRVEEAKRAYHAALPVAERDLTAHSNLGALLLAEERWAEAAWVYTDALKRDDASADAHLGLANALTQLGRLDEAIVELRVCTRLRAPTAATHHLMAQLYLHRGEPEAALAEALEAVAGAPQEASYHLNLARALVAAGQLDEASRSFRMFLTLKPDADEAPRVRRWLEQRRTTRLSDR